MQIFFDTEFHDRTETFTCDRTGKQRTVRTIDLISIGMVDDKGREYYAICSDADVERIMQNEWLKTNVMKPIYDQFAKMINNKFLQKGFTTGTMQTIFYNFGKSKKTIAREIEQFAGQSPEFWAYFAAYDWVVFCWIWGGMMDLPDNFPRYCRDLKQRLDETSDRIGHTVDFVKSKVVQPHGVEHCAITDAQWNLNLSIILDTL